MAASTLYAPLPLFKSYLGVDADDDSRDDLLAYALASASRMVDKDTGRRFWLDAAPVARVLDVAGRVLPGGVLLVPDIGDVEGLVVEAGSSVAWSTVTGVEPWSPGDWATTTQLRYTGGWPCWGQVRVTARWGWASVPFEITQATMIRAAALFKRKDSTEGVLGAGEFGVVRVARGDPDYRDLVSAFVIHAFA